MTLKSAVVIEQSARTPQAALQAEIGSDANLIVPGACSCCSGARG